MTQPDWSMRAPCDAKEVMETVTLSREQLIQLRRLAIGYVRMIDEALGLPQTIPDKETRRRERQGR